MDKNLSRGTGTPLYSYNVKTGKAYNLLGDLVVPTLEYWYALFAGMIEPKKNLFERIKDVFSRGKGKGAIPSGSISQKTPKKRHEKGPAPTPEHEIERPERKIPPKPDKMTEKMKKKELVRILREHGIEENNATEEQRQFYGQFIGLSQEEIVSKVAEEVSKSKEKLPSELKGIMQSMKEAYTGNDGKSAIDSFVQQLKSDGLHYDVCPTEMMSMVLGTLPRGRNYIGDATIPAKRDLLEISDTEQGKLVAMIMLATDRVYSMEDPNDLMQPNYKANAVYETERLEEVLKDRFLEGEATITKNAKKELQKARRRENDRQRREAKRQEDKQKAFEMKEEIDAESTAMNMENVFHHNSATRLREGEPEVYHVDVPESMLPKDEKLTIKDRLKKMFGAKDSKENNADVIEEIREEVFEDSETEEESTTVSEESVEKGPEAPLDSVFHKAESELGVRTGFESNTESSKATKPFNVMSEEELRKIFELEEEEQEQ